MDTVYDAIIVGAGPAGSATAIALGQRGRNVLLLERMHFPRDKVCGECLSPGAAPILERLGVLGALEDAGAGRYYGFRLIAPGGRSCDLVYPDIRGAPAYGWCLPRRRLDALLLDRARRELTVRVLEGFHVRWADRRPDRWWEVSGFLERRERQSFAARALVIAGGRHSAFLPRPPALRDPQRLCLVGTFRGVAGVEPLIECGVVGKGLQYLVGPQGPDTAVICAIITAPRDRLAGVGSRTLLGGQFDCIPALHTRLAPAEPVSPVRGMAIRPYLTPRLADDGRVLVGDTTGFIDPITGEGMYRALWSGERAAWVLHAALAQGDLSRRALSPYERAMREEFRWLYRFVRLCAWATNRPGLIERVVERLRGNPGLQRTLAGVQGALLPARTFFSWRTLAQLAGAGGYRPCRP